MSLNFAEFYSSGVILSQNKGRLWCASGWCQKPIGFTSLETPIFYDPHFDFKYENQVIVPEQIRDMSATGFLESFEPQAFRSSRIPDLVWKFDKQKYKQDYQNLIKKMRSGNLQKAVPFMTFKAQKPKKFRQEVLPLLIQNLLERASSQFIYGAWNKEGGFLGATPEILMSGTRSSLDFMALAGTLKSEASNMLEEPKLISEHKFVVQDIGEKLSHLKLDWGETHEVEYGPLKHLRTLATCKDYKGNFIQDIRKLSPTAALGTYPPEALKECQQDLQVSERGTYGAPFGLISKDQVHILVCLRGIFWNQEEIHIPVGGGILLQSDYQTEVSELELKFESTKVKLGL